MQYENAVNQLLDVNAASTFLLYVIAAILLFILIGQAVKLWRDLFGKPKEDEDKEYEQHCKDSDERFQEDEKHIKENRENIADLREGFRASCISIKALLNHAIHNGNTAEMEKAVRELDNYLINRK